MEKIYTICKENPELYWKLMLSLDQNDGYCPCRLEKTPDTKCMCKEFREMEEGTCHCGLYIKVKE